MPRLSDERGFTLVEVLVTAVVLAVGILGAMQVFDAASRTSGAAERFDVVVHYGDKAVDELRAVPYADLAVRHSASWPAAGADPGEPAARVSGTTYRVPGGPDEELVPFAASAAAPDYEERTVGPYRLAVYRFVSWRDEECPVADLAALDTALADAQGLLTATTTSLSGMVGPGGSLTAALADANGLLSGGLLTGAGLGQLLSAVTGAAAVLTPIKTLLTSPALLAPLQGALTRVDAVLDPVTGRVKDRIDLCDVPAGTLPDLHEVQALNAALGSLKPVLATTAPLTAHVGTLLHSLVGLNAVGLLGAVVKAPLIVADTTQLSVQRAALQSVLAGTVDTAGDPVQLATLAGRVSSSLSALAAFASAPDTTHNTKRVTVAIKVLDAPARQAPRRPLWFTTVVTNPADGLL